ncbi:hypothetical protein ACIBEJ_00945 [Nonomuraea sp. NPDC050790]|uniref:hypothetical protein n=1 Tax=Nonomuraea sp. NPDC050790 TaxID=3364371 RepID=UPI00379493F3
MTQHAAPNNLASPLVVISAEMITSVQRFLPPDMWYVEADLKQLHQFPGNVAAAVQLYFNNLSNGYPIDPRIIDMAGEFTTHLAGASDYATAIETAFSQIHEDDIRRRLLPRAGEWMWNI